MKAGLELAVSTGAEFGRVVQFAIHAPSIETFARRWSNEMGAGPFYLLEHIALAKSLYRGVPARFDHSSAYGQLGDIMIELIHQHDDAPSAVRDMFAAHEAGLHHAAIFVDDIDAAVREAGRRGMAITLDAETADGVRFVMADARVPYGCMLEFYEPLGALKKFYAFVRRKSEGWDRKDYLRKL
jgi:catechol 2,3-dioxygenase-like lactoylglutathione lyase family enzyme